MSSKEVELDFEFTNDELANFLENFANKVREGKVGLSFKGREQVEIEPTEKTQLQMDFEQKDTYKELEIQMQLREEVESTEEGRRKISVEIV